MKKLKDSIINVAELLGLTIPNIDETRSRRSYNRYILEYQSVLSEPDDAIQTVVLMETSFTYKCHFQRLFCQFTAILEI